MWTGPPAVSAPAAATGARGTLLTTSVRGRRFRMATQSHRWRPTSPALPSGNDGLFTDQTGEHRGPSNVDPRAGPPPGCPADRVRRGPHGRQCPLRDCIVRGHGNQPGRPTSVLAPARRAGWRRRSSRWGHASESDGDPITASRPDLSGLPVGNRAQFRPARGNPGNAFVTPAVGDARALPYPSFSPPRTPHLGRRPRKRSP